MRAVLERTAGQEQGIDAEEAHRRLDPQAQEPDPASIPPPTATGSRAIPPSPVPGGPEAAAVRRNRILFAAWAAFILGVTFFEPAPANPNAAIPAWEVVVAALFLPALFGTFGGLLARRPWAFGLSLATAGLGFVLAVSCLGTGHHAGLFPFLEMAATGLLGVASLTALRAERRRGSTSG